ncbi:MAG: nitrous oxide reductase accessory protein NosL [Candidatus Zixiibacteriota bacterium]
MHLLSRLLLVVAALLLSLTYFFPLWEISLDAPQYPEGLGLEIWINQMQGQNPGDLNKINNLNHYIGMKQIKPESIPELSIMPWIMRGVMIAGLLVAAVGRRMLLMIWLVLFLAVATAGLIDFYLWGYDYGHNLDTHHAIIKVPGMSYQPPLIGSKKLLNFKAISLPGVGGWFAMASFVLGGLVWFYEFSRVRRVVPPKTGPAAGMLACLLLGLAVSCSPSGPSPIRYGSDQCAYCKMTIADEKFGTESITGKGKIYKYDSIECLAADDMKSKQTIGQVHSRWVTDFGHPGTFLEVSVAVVVATEKQKSPMGVGLVAVASQSDAVALIASVGGAVLDWNAVKKLVAETWKLTEKQ